MGRVHSEGDVRVWEGGDGSVHGETEFAGAKEENTDLLCGHVGGG